MWYDLNFERLTKPGSSQRDTQIRLLSKRAQFDEYRELSYLL